MAYTTIDKPTDYFNTVLYTGNGSTQSITGVGFQPDWVWCKSRNQADNHAIFDSVRGGQQQLRSNSTDAELTRTNAISSFDSDGWSMGSQPEMNSNTITYASWNWLAGGTASSNTDGSITSSVSANTTAGFSIVTWTAPSSGANTDTIGHGLSAVPKMIIARTRSDADGWRVYHHAPGIDKHGSLNNTNAFNSNTNIFPTLPTTSIFYPGSDASINSSSRTYVAYCFAEKKGFSKFGSYTGNGNADGTFVYTGFKPAWFMVKRTDTSGNPWIINDNKRDPFNFCRKNLFADASDAEVDVTSESGTWDLLSNGVKMRNSGTSLNGSGSTYIYMAFAENPFVTSTGIPCTAR